jgi:hypothetical protein
MPILNFGELVEKRWNTNLPLKKLQDKVLPPPYNPIILDGEVDPIHKNKKPLLLKNELDFIPFPFNSNITVSNIGRIKYNNEFADQFYDNNNGTLYIKTSIKPEYIHRLVAITWWKYNVNEYPDVHHYDNNGYNNIKENLLMATRAQHTMIHIKGTWKKENYQIRFFENIFTINSNVGIFKCNDIGWNDETKNYDINLVLYFNNTPILFNCDNNTNKYKMILYTCNKEYNILNGIWERLDYK